MPQSPDYEGYTRRMVSDIKKGQQGRKAYAKKGAHRQLDFTTHIGKDEPGTDWIYEGRGKTPREAVRRRFNKASDENVRAWKREYKGREAYDRSEGGIKHYDTSRKKSQKMARRRAVKR